MSDAVTALSAIQFKIEPHIGVGQFTFGMPRATVRQILNTPYKEFMKTPPSIVPTDAFDDVYLHVYYANNFICNGIEFFLGSQVTLYDPFLIGCRVDEVMSWLKECNSNLIVEDSRIESKKLGISLYVPDADEGAAAVVENVYVYKKLI